MSSGKRYLILLLVLVLVALTVFLIIPKQTRLEKDGLSIVVPYRALFPNVNVYNDQHGYNKYVWIQSESRIDSAGFADLRSDWLFKRGEYEKKYAEFDTDAFEAFAFMGDLTALPQIYYAYIRSKSSGRVWSIEFWNIPFDEVTASIKSIQLP